MAIRHYASSPFDFCKRKDAFSMLFIHAQLHTMRGEIIPDGFLLEKEGKIAALGAMTDCPEVPAGEENLDLAGRLLLPGFVDAHSHLGMIEEGVGPEGEDINEMSDPCTPQVRAIDAIDPFDVCFEEARRAGVTTTVSSPGSANPIAGEICALKTVGRWVDKMVVAAPLAMKFALGENPKRIYGNKEEAPISRMATAAIIRENLAKARRYGEDIAKAEKEGESLPDLDVKLEALLPVLRGEIGAHFHAHRAYDILTAVRLAEEFGLRLTLIHCTEGHRIADILAEAGYPAVCGPIIGTRSKPELSNMSLENCATLLRAGVEVAVSTDHPEVPVGFLPLSAAIASANGIGGEGALLSLTYRAAKAVGLENRVGSLAPGLDADLQVYSSDPLSVGAKPEMVFIDGQRVV